MKDNELLLHLNCGTM